MGQLRPGRQRRLRMVLEQPAHLLQLRHRRLALHLAQRQPVVQRPADLAQQRPRRARWGLHHRLLASAALCALRRRRPEPTGAVEAARQRPRHPGPQRTRAQLRALEADGCERHAVDHRHGRDRCRDRRSSLRPDHQLGPSRHHQRRRRVRRPQTFADAVGGGLSVRRGGRHRLRQWQPCLPGERHPHRRGDRCGGRAPDWGRQCFLHRKRSQRPGEWHHHRERGRPVLGFRPARHHPQRRGERDRVQLAAGHGHGGRGEHDHAELHLSTARERHGPRCDQQPANQWRPGLIHGRQHRKRPIRRVHPRGGNTRDLHGHREPSGLCQSEPERDRDQRNDRDAALPLLAGSGKHRGDRHRRRRHQEPRRGCRFLQWRKHDDERCRSVHADQRRPWHLHRHHQPNRLCEPEPDGRGNCRERRHGELRPEPGDGAHADLQRWSRKRVAQQLDRSDRADRPDRKRACGRVCGRRQHHAWSDPRLQDLGQLLHKCLLPRLLQHQVAEQCLHTLRRPEFIRLLDRPPVRDRYRATAADERYRRVELVWSADQPRKLACRRAPRRDQRDLEHDGGLAGWDLPRRAQPDHQPRYRSGQRDSHGRTQQRPHLRRRVR